MSSSSSSRAQSPMGQSMSQFELNDDQRNIGSGIITVDVQSILKMISNLESKMSDVRPDRMPNWAVKLHERLEKLEKNITQA